MFTLTMARRAPALGVYALLAGCNADPGATAGDGSPTSTAGSGESGTDDTGDGDTSGGATSSGDAPLFPEVPAGDCGRPDLRRAQPAVLVDGVPAVPVDIEAVEATIVLDAEAGVATSDATVQFVMGGAAGRPVLDLRQTVTALALNGEPLDPLDFPAVDFGGGKDAELRLLRAQVEACAMNALDLSYELGAPQAPGARGIGWGPEQGRVRWNFDLSDREPGRFMEQWLPANLIHDQHTITLDVEVVGAEVPHAVVANAAVEVLAEGSRWRLSWPASANAMSPLVVVWPADELDSFELPVALPDAQAITVAVHKPAEYEQDLPVLAQRTADALIEFSKTTGPYVHGDRFTVVMGIGDDAMEYDGGTVIAWSAVEHEVFHSWYGRGVRPARQPDGWIDEGWASYNTTPGPAFEIEPLPLDLTPFQLRDDNPWSRVWSPQSYGIGNALFAGLAALMGLDALRAHMADFYDMHALEAVTTEDLERHLACESGHEFEVRARFHRYVHGRAYPLPAADAVFCD